MRERQIEHYHMKGYEAFFTEAMPSIKTILDERLADKEGHFAMAIVEAVQNAAMYSKAGARNVQLDIDLVATETDIAVKVSADTKDFDVLAYRQRLGRMAPKQVKIALCFLFSKKLDKETIPRMNKTPADPIHKKKISASLNEEINCR